VRDESGFTLVEILVVITLLSVIMLALGAAMRTIAQTEERVDDRLQRSDQMRVATGFLESALGRVSARRSAPAMPGAASAPLFSGAPDAVAWVGVMPARYGAGGRNYFRLMLERQGAKTNLVLRFAPWNGAGAFPDWQGADSRALVKEVTSLGIEYAQEDGPAQLWRTEWPFSDRLPSRIRLSVRTGATAWPPIVIEMRALPAGDSGRGGFSLGPE
jgi:general secretion pathway protein J